MLMLPRPALSTRHATRLPSVAALLFMMVATTASASPQVDPAASRPVSLDAIAQLLSGTSAIAVEDLDDRNKTANTYVAQAQSLWQRYESKIGNKLVKWAAETLTQPTSGTVFYPFSGPDFPTVYQFYPDADRYVLVALQKGGRVPNLRTYNIATFKTFLRLFKRGWTSFSKRGFFHTDHMKRDMEEGSLLEGITPILMAFSDRMGFQVDRVEPVAISDAGALVVQTTALDTRETWDSVRLAMTRRADGKKVVLDYVFLDLSDGYLQAHAGARQWVQAMSHSPVVTKAASHLMQKPFFSVIAAAILDAAPSVLQDETGLDYKAMKQAFTVSLFGDFTRANKLWTEGVQRSLSKAYERRKDIQPLPFKVGYRKDSGSCIQYGVRP